MTEMSIREALLARKKDELEEAVLRLGLEPLKKSAKKADWADYILREMPERKECVRLMLRFSAYPALREAAKTGAPVDSDEVMADDALMDSLCALRMIGLARNLHGEWYVHPDTAEYLAIEKEEEMEQRMNDLLYDIMQGWLIHVGMMPLPDMLEKMDAVLPPMPEDEREAAKDVCFALLLARMGLGRFMPEDDALWIIGEDVDDPEQLLARLREPHIAALKYPDFTPEELAGSVRFLHLPGDAALYDPLRSELEKLDFDAEEVEDLLDDMVYLIQNDERNEALSVLLDAVGDVSGRQMERIVQLCMDLSNQIPLWSNKGHSAGELMGQMQRKLPKMPGRNDPCTCGSGKKYKLCCGKRIN